MDSSGSTGRVLVALDDGLIGAGATIDAIEVRAWMARGGGATKKAKLSYQRMGSDATPVDGTEQTITPGGCCSQEVVESWGILGWTTADTDNLEIGIAHTASGKSRASQLYVIVTFTPPAIERPMGPPLQVEIEG